VTPHFYAKSYFDNAITISSVQHATKNESPSNYTHQQHYDPSIDCQRRQQNSLLCNFYFLLKFNQVDNMNPILLLFTLFSCASAFVPVSDSSRTSLKLSMAEEETKAAPLVSGEDLEMMLTEWEQPLVIDAYATW
jgi:hypothetical protein